MPEVIYIKAPPSHTLYRKPPLSTKIRTVLSLMFIFTGIALFTSVAYPLLSYQLTLAPVLKNSNLLAPSPSIKIKPIKAAEPKVLPELTPALDYTDPSKWFPAYNPTPNPSPLPSDSPTYYTLSIPKLGIESALVKIGGKDLKKSLVHYPSTALPGTLGNAVVFGHSVLPQFFNPKNYLSIFSTLYTLSKGDEIIIEFDGVVYTYTIVDMYEVVPSDLSPLIQTYDNYYLTLITCTPPGTYLRRLIVKAVLSS